jgi:hypothetical protein
MPSYVTPKINTAFVFYTSLEDAASPGSFKASPTLAAGDVLVATGDGAPANIATLPTVDADFTKRLKVSLSAGEMNGDNVTVLFSDAAGAEWFDLEVNIQTSARQIDDLAYPTVSGNSLDVSATGEAGLDFANVKAATAPTTLTNLTIPTVTTLTNMPAAAPTASDNATAAAAAILVTPANKLATGTDGIASANVTLWKGDVPADLDASGNVLVKLADAATHGGSTAELSLKKVEIVNNDQYGTALLLYADALGGKGLNVQSDDEQNTGLYARWPLAQKQDVADSMALAPTPGTPDDGSVYDLLADVGSGSGLTAQETADAVNNLAPASTGATGSIRAKLDAIKLTTDAIDTSAVTITSTNNAGVLTFTKGVTFAATVSGLTISGTWAKLYFTLKESDYDDDDDAILQLVETNPGAGTDGLLYLGGAAIASPITASDGTLTVSQAAGTVAIAITDNATVLLDKSSALVWDIKTKDASGATVQNATGTASILRSVTQTI